jgi:hypothetical protein
MPKVMRFFELVFIVHICIYFKLELLHVIICSLEQKQIQSLAGCPPSQYMKLFMDLKKQNTLSLQNKKEREIEGATFALKV